MNLVGIITALRVEASCITALHVPYNEMARLSEYSAIWLCGMGDSAARSAAKAFLEQGATALVSFGVAGALNPKLRPGDLVLPELIHATRMGGLQRAHAKLSTYPVSLEWRYRILELLAPHINIINGILATSPVVLTSEKSKLKLAEATGACAVDMESSAIAEVAANAGVPFIAIRAISDPVDHSLPPALINAINPEGRVKMIRLLTLLLQRSVHINTLFRLRNETLAARRTLSAVIRYADKELGMS